MTEQRMVQVTLTQFRDKIAGYRGSVEVSRRDGEGNIQILGVWTPYMTYPVESEPVKPLELLIDDEPAPRVISSPAEAAAAVKVDPVRAVPKPGQQKKRSPR